MVCAEAKGCRRFLVELFLDRQRRFALGEAGAISNAEDVCVDREGFGTECRVHHDIGGLSTYAGQRL